MSDIPSTPDEEQEQTQLVVPLAVQSQMNEQPASSDVQTENQETLEATTIFADQQESGFQFVMFAPGQQPVDQPPATPQAGQMALIPPPITAPLLPLPASTKPQYRTSPLVKGILIAQSLALIIGAVLLLYINVYEPARISAEATATTGTAFAKSTSTFKAVTSTAQVNATNTANTHATATAETKAESTATATALQNLYKEATKGTPFISSPMAYDNTSANWEVILHGDNTGCFFTGEGYHAITDGGFYQDCLAVNTNLKDFTYEMEVELKSGDIGGLFFRAKNGSGYILFLTTVGTYKLFRGDYDAVAQWISYTDLTTARSSALKEGYNQKNLITVVVRGTSISIFINKQYATTVHDSKFPSGQIGVVAVSEADNGLTDIAFRNLKVWKL